MSLSTVLFNPNGRIGPRDFWRGVIVLVAAMIVFQVASVYGGTLLGGLLGVITVAMPYPYLCVYGKRLHDAGRSAWFFLLFLLGYVMFDGLFQYIALPVLSPEAADLRKEMTMLLEQGQFADAFAYGPQIARESLLTALISLFIVNAVLGWLAARLPSEQGTNAHGPPTGWGQG